MYDHEGHAVLIANGSAPRHTSARITLSRVGNTYGVSLFEVGAFEVHVVVIFEQLLLSERVLGQKLAARPFRGGHFGTAVWRRHRNAQYFGGEGGIACGGNFGGKRCVSVSFLLLGKTNLALYQGH